MEKTTTVKLGIDPKRDALDILNAFIKDIENDVIQIDNVIMKTSADRTIIELVRKESTNAF